MAEYYSLKEKALVEEINKLIYEILSEGYVMSIATVDECGVWVADVVYIYDGVFNIYWISQISTRHSQAIQKNNQVAASITISQPGEDNRGLQIEGSAEAVDRTSLEMLRKHLIKRAGKVPYQKPFFENNILLDPEMSWYKLTPKKIELIYEKYYGFTKQVVELK